MDMIKLYVGNLPFSINDASLRDLFSEFGDVQSASVVLDRETGRSRGFGFVEMERSAGEEAMNSMNGKSVDGRNLVVNEARPREDRPRGGGGGGGGRGGFGRGGGGGGGGRGGW